MGGFHAAALLDPVLPHRARKLFESAVRQITS